MKLFYHFLIFVFVSLILIACANIFTADDNTKIKNNEPSGSKQSSENKVFVFTTTTKGNNLYMLSRINYKRLLKGKRWADNQCYLKNMKLVITQFVQPE